MRRNAWKWGLAIARFERETHAWPDGVPCATARALPLLGHARVAAFEAAIGPARDGHAPQRAADPLERLPALGLRRLAQVLPVDQRLQRLVGSDEVPEALQRDGVFDGGIEDRSERDGAGRFRILAQTIGQELR